MAIRGIEKNVRWRDSLEEAREEARSEGKLVFIFLWHHNCGGSKMMDEATYPDGVVRMYIEEHFVPVRFNTIERPEVEESFNSGWTPTIIVEDAEGREHRRSQGYLDPKRFIGEMALARVEDAMDRHDYEAVIKLSKEALERTEGDQAREPEALYWSAVGAFEVSGDRDDLTGGWNRLLEEFPQSEWAEKASYIHKQ